MKKISILLISKLFLFTLLINAKPLKEITLNLNPTINEEKYHPTDIYEEPKELPLDKKKEKDTSINVDIDVNKEQKQIDSLKLDLDKKF